MHREDKQRIDDAAFLAVIVAGKRTVDYVHPSRVRIQNERPGEYRLMDIRADVCGVKHTDCAVVAAWQVFERLAG